MESNVPQAAIEKLWSASYIESLSHRRSRRVGLGFASEGGSLKHKSENKPVPLTTAETALLCFAGAGVTGLALGDSPTDRGGNSQISCAGRSFPSPCNNQRTHLIFTNDDGVYIYKPRMPKKPVEIEKANDLIEQVKEFEKDIIKLKDGRLEIPSGPPALVRANELTVNRPGQTVFMPIVDPAYELVSLLLLLVQYEKFHIIDAETGKSAGVEKWADKLKLKVKVPLQTLEPNVLATCAMEGASIMQNILLMAQAMGLGAFPLGGFTSIIAMGGTPLTRGLGFRFVTDKKGHPRPIGIDGILEGFCPPYWKNMDSVVDAVVENKFGVGGVFHGETTPSPLLDQRTFAEGVDRISEDVIHCVKDICNYVYDKYGAFPATVSPMNMLVWVVAQHLDLDFYAKYYRPELITENFRTHMQDWH